MQRRLDWNIKDFNSTLVQFKHFNATGESNLISYFNSTLVQFKQIRIICFFFEKHYFNSTLVQFKLLGVYKLHQRKSLFQFYFSPIQTITFRR